MKEAAARKTDKAEPKIQVLPFVRIYFISFITNVLLLLVSLSA